MVQSGSASGSLFAEGGVGTLKLLAYLALATILMVADHHGGYLESIRRTAGLMTGPLYRLASAPADLARGLSGHMTTQQALIAENTALRENLLLANARLDRLASVQVENQRLRELLGGTRGLRLEVQLASLIDIDLDPFRHRLMLDAGSRRGVEEGLAVIDAEGVMGQVLTVTPAHSTVILISDPSHAIPVQVMRTGLRAIAYGTGRTDQLEVPSIPLSADLRVGDVLETSGIGGRFPAGFRVGTIERLHPDDTRLFVVAEVRPAARLDRGGEVLLVWNTSTSADAEDVGPPLPPGFRQEAPDTSQEIEP
ncbi:rod shape-determining protein MreC [Xanthomonadaceae bacterium JHOS43]|nr:rod shape-determining protein MreC [Xanthomonadaceae bacterium JHOS43]MCX7564142.1 rod shape-determining protein MreC [Xanthomonadaceae bacterium XH05]